MEKGAEKVPNDTNCKIIFRHSIRHRIDLNDIRATELTNEGIELAKSFGRGIGCKIGFVGSSTCTRNIQTCEEIFNGCGYVLPINHARNELELPQVNNKELSNKTFKEYNFENTRIIYALKNNGLPGFNSLEKASKIMFDYMFSNGNKENTVDLFCTHDFQMAILYAHLFDFGKTKDDFAKYKWPMMLEGMITWGTKSHFWCSWRGEIKEFVDMF
jgi:hypothetical protein